jgi:hypothetical protein
MAWPIHKNEPDPGRATMEKRTKFPAAGPGGVQAQDRLRVDIPRLSFLPGNAATVGFAPGAGGTNPHRSAQTLRPWAGCGLACGPRSFLQEELIGLPAAGFSDFCRIGRTDP